MGSFGRTDTLLRSECLVEVRGGQTCDSLDLARVKIDIGGLHSGYMIGFFCGGGCVYIDLASAGEIET